jgi:GntR family transcriptional regulator, transcriptional repressor for pyruvate dehydrogenase complex
MKETTKGKTSRGAESEAEVPAAGQVVDFVRRQIEAGRLKPGARLPAERDLAEEIGVSRPSLRSGLQTLQALGVIQSRQGAGTFIADGPPRLGGAPLSFLAALHGFTRDDMFEARRVLELGAASLAAERATSDRIATLADEVTAMFASLDDPQEYLIHDVQFHKAVAAASGNPVLATLIDTISELVYETRRRTVERAHDLKESAEMHRRIYRAIKARDPEKARDEMATHLSLARQAQASEEEPKAPKRALRA